MEYYLRQMERRVILCIVLLATATVRGQETLLATTDIASQSSDATVGSDVRVATYAVDGNDVTCSLTQTEDDPWWRVQLEQDSLVKKVLITNYRRSRDAAKLEGAEISVGSCNTWSSNTICGTVSLGQATSGQQIHITCPPDTYGQYVYVTQSGVGKSVGFCEIVVYGSENPRISTVSFASPTYSVLESASSVVIEITRTGQTSSCYSFEFSTLSDSAISPHDFIGSAESDTNQQFQFDPGEMTKQISVEIVDDTEAEAVETFTVQLQKPIGGVIGNVGTAEVSILDDDSTTPNIPTTTPNIPTTTPYVPTTTPNVPTTTPIVPTTTPNVPTTTPNVPTTTPSIPTTTPNIPTTTPNIPTTTPNIPTTPNVPTTTPNVPITTPNVPTTTPNVLTTAPNVPTTTPSIPTTTPNIPTTTPNIPTTTSNIPTTPNVPTTTPNVPTTTPNVPTTTPNVLTTAPNVPTTTPNVPTTTPNVPATTPTVPTTTPNVPTTTPNIPTTTPNDPTTTPKVPTTTPNIPTTTPNDPTTTPKVPTTTPNIPTTTPNVPTSTPTVPTTTPTVPITTSNVPTTTTNVPTTTPNVPTTSLDVTTTTPNIPTTTPYVPTTTPTVPATTPTVPTTTPNVPTTTPNAPTTTPIVSTTPNVLTTPTVPTTTPTVPTTTPTVPTTTPNIRTTTPNAPTTTPTVPTTTNVLTTTPNVPATTPAILTTTPSILTTAPLNISTTTTNGTFMTTEANYATSKNVETTNNTLRSEATTQISYNTTYTNKMITVNVTWTVESTTKQFGNAESCPMEVTNIDGLVLTWPETMASAEATSVEKCANYSANAGESKGVRLCFFADNVARWYSPIPNKCIQGMETNIQLEKLAKMTVTTENVEEISSDLVELTERSEELDSEGLESAAEILENIVGIENYTSEMVAVHVIETLDNLLEVDPAVFREAQRSDETATRLLLTFETEASMMRDNGTDYSFEGDHMSIVIVQIPRDVFKNGFTFVPTENEQTDDRSKPTEPGYTMGTEDRQTAIYLPEAILDFIDSDMVSVSFVVYENSQLFQSYRLADQSTTRLNRQFVGGKIISATVSHANVQDLPKDDPVVSTFSTSKANNVRVDGMPLCVFWDFTLAYGAGDWSSEGCFLASYDAGQAICHCDHLTNFAVLLDVRGGVISSPVLDLVSKIGCAISIAALVVTILTYLNIRTLRTKQPQRILIHLSFSLLGLYSVFLAGIEQTRSYSTCIFVAALLHYFTLTSIFWMAVEAVNMYYVFIKVFNVRVSRFLLKASLFAWGVPLAIVLLVAVVDHTQYRNENHCFLRPEIAFSFAVVLLIILVLVFNFFIFFMVMYRLTCGRKSRKTNGNMVTEGFKRLQNAMTISVLLGLTWLFGFLSIIDSAVYEFQLVFCVFNSLQGLFIFLLFCVRQEEVRLAWRAWFSGSTIRSLSMSSHLSSTRKRTSSNSSAIRNRLSGLYRTRDSKGNLKLSLGNLSENSANTMNTDGITSDAGEFSPDNTTSQPPTMMFKVGKIVTKNEERETLSTDSGVPNINDGEDQEISK